MILGARTLIAMELIPFPKPVPQAFIPSELHMPREVPRDQVTLEVIHTLLAEAGYESTLDDEAIYVQRTGCGLRLRVEPDFAFLRINALYHLNPALSEPALHHLLARLNENYQVLKLTSYRWDDGDLSLWASHQVHYPFGLNIPNFLFMVRKVNETMVYLYNNDLKGTSLIPPPQREADDEEASHLSLVPDSQDQ